MSWSIPNPRTNSPPRRITPPDVGSGVSETIKIVRILDVVGKQQATSARVLKVSFTTSPPAAHDAIIVEETDEVIIVANPRDNYLEPEILYFAFRVGGIWCVDNQATFQNWMG